LLLLGCGIILRPMNGKLEHSLVKWRHEHAIREPGVGQFASRPQAILVEIQKPVASFSLYLAGNAAKLPIARLRMFKLDVILLCIPKGNLRSRGQSV
jgi:hypothetical protein